MSIPAMRRAKIVATLGPATETESQIRALILAGMNVARLNFSHGSQEMHRQVISRIRSASLALDRPVTILQDLQGPKIRVGELPQKLSLHSGQTVVLHVEGVVPQSSPRDLVALPISAEIARVLLRDLQVGARVLFDDGRISTEVIRAGSDEVLVTVESGGILSSHKGMNLPDTPLSLACLTHKDETDLKFGLEQEVDAVALSFVRSPQDLIDLRARIYSLSANPPLLIPKIERREALECQDAIIAVSDALLIARGDMAVEIGAERVPLVQKELIARCNGVGLPVITATQMLESMVQCPTPTRAEASDVANAIFDGSDALMLSAETASGNYALESVATMDRIIRAAESAHYRRTATPPIWGSAVDAIECSAALIGERLEAKAIVCLTHTGAAARALARYRPSVPIIAITDQQQQLRRLGLVWGVSGITIAQLVPTDDLFGVVGRALLEKGAVALGDTIVVTAGIPTLQRGTTNMVKIHTV